MFYDIFKRLCDMEGISVSRAADELDISRGTVTHWKKHGTMPTQKTLAKINARFGINLEIQRLFELGKVVTGQIQLYDPRQLVVPNPVVDQKEIKKRGSVSIDTKPMEDFLTEEFLKLWDLAPSSRKKAIIQLMESLTDAEEDKE